MKNHALQLFSGSNTPKTGIRYLSTYGSGVHFVLITLPIYQAQLPLWPVRPVTLSHLLPFSFFRLFKPEICNSNLLQSRIVHHLVICSDFCAHRRSDYASAPQSRASNHLAYTSAYHYDSLCIIRVKRLIRSFIWLSNEKKPKLLTKPTCEKLLSEAAHKKQPSYPLKTT